MHMFQSKLDVETLDERIVPSTVRTIDLTTRDAWGLANGGIVRQVSPQPTGTGYIQSFVRIQGAASGGSQQGLNSSGRPLQFDENKSPQFTRAVQLGQLQLVTVNGKEYYQFLLDINQKSSSPLLSLDQVEIYLNSSGSLTRLQDVRQGQLVYNMDGAGDVTVKLNATLNSGSGSGDMVLLIPREAFGDASPNQFVYLYSQFGLQPGMTANGGFEEWAFSAIPVSLPPEATGGGGNNGGGNNGGGNNGGGNNGGGNTVSRNSIISGSVYFDANQDLSDGWNDVIRGVTVSLYRLDANGNLELYRTTSTDENGAYEFAGLEAGSYLVVQGDTPGFTDGFDYLDGELIDGSRGNENDGYWITLDGTNRVSLVFTEYYGE